MMSVCVRPLRALMLGFVSSLKEPVRTLTEGNFCSCDLCHHKISYITAMKMWPKPTEIN